MPPSGALPTILTSSLLSSLRTHPHLPSQTWYFIAGVTLSVLNRSDEIPTVYRYAVDHGTTGAGHSKTEEGRGEEFKMARRMREALIKSVPTTGLPKVINALYALKTATPSSLLDEPSTGSSPTGRADEISSTPLPVMLERGQRFFDQVYGKVSTRVMGQMDRSGTEDLGITARLMYGYLLSNTSVLTSAETSFVLLASLIPQDVNPQLKGHLKGALNNGATVEEIRAVREVVIRICEASGMKNLGDRVPGGWGWRGEISNL